MKKISATNLIVYFVFLLDCLISACENPADIKNKSSQIKPADEKPVVHQFSDPLKKYEEPAQSFIAPTNKSSAVKGRKGTKILVNPADLVTESGKPFGQNITVELKELTNQGDLLKTNAQTVSDGKLLVSGGAYFIEMFSDGQRLKLKEGKTLAVQFPKLSDKEMALFYGQRNDSGQMNWKQAPENFKSSQQKKPAEQSDTLSNRKSAIDAILYYVDSGYNPTPAEKERNRKLHRSYVAAQKVYDAIGLSKLGWINCDHFLDADNNTELYVTLNPMDSIEYANVYLIFKDINSVMQGYFSDRSQQFSNIPLGYKVRLIAYAGKDEKIFAYSTDLIITKGQKIKLSLKEISQQDFKKLIGKQ